MLDWAHIWQTCWPYNSSGVATIFYKPILCNFGQINLIRYPEDSALSREHNTLHNGATTRFQGVLVDNYSLWRLGVCATTKHYNQPELTEVVIYWTPLRVASLSMYKNRWYVPSVVVFYRWVLLIKKPLKRPTWYALRISRIECECDPSLCRLFATAVISSQTILVTINKDQWPGTGLSTMDNNFFHQVFPEYTWYCRSKYVKCHHSFRNGSSHVSDIHYNIMFVHQEFMITCYKQLCLYSQSLKNISAHML